MILARKYFGKKIFNRIFAVMVGLAEMLQRGWTGRHSLLVKMIFFLPCSIVFLLLNSQKMKAICNANASNHIPYYDDEKIKNWLSAMGQLQLLPLLETNSFYSEKEISDVANIT